MAPTVFVAMVVLSAAGLLPVLALVGLRWITIPLVPLAGAVMAALATTCFVATGGTLMGWFVGLAVLGAASITVLWVVRPDRRLRALVTRSGTPRVAGYRGAGVVGALGIVAACIWSLRSLSSPTVGFDARAVWLQRAGWFLQSHHQLLIDLRVPYLELTQSAYPPLVSASTAVAWSVTGNHSLRLGVIVISLLNASALATAAFALVECGRGFAARLSTAGEQNPTKRADSTRSVPVRTPLAPMAVGVVVAVLLVFVAFGITEPFMTNGYADPIWSLAALGAVVYGLQMPIGRAEQGATVLLLLVAGMSKDEGVAIAGALVVLVTLRRLMVMPVDQRRDRWRRPVLIGVVELVAVGAWPILMRIAHARGQSSSFSSPGAMASRAHATYDGFAPYLHVLLLALPIAVVGGLLLSLVRRRCGAANDWWAWAALASGLSAVGGALIVGSGAIGPWLMATVHRVTEFPALTGWWIVAVWAVVASGAPVIARSAGLPAQWSASAVDSHGQPDDHISSRRTVS